VRVIREVDGAIDPLRHARPLAPPPAAQPEKPAEPPAQPWPVAVDDFTLSAPTVVIVDPPSGENLLQFSLEKFDLDSVAIQADKFSLGGLGIEGPVLRVRRDLVLTKPKAGPVEVAAAGVAPAVPSAPAVPAAAPPPAAAPSAASAPAPAVAPAPAPAPVAPPTVVAEPATSPTPGAAPVGAAPVPATAPAKAPPSAAHAAPPGYSIEKIDVERATFTWVTDKGPLDVAITLKASNITADEGKRFPIDLKLDIASGHIALAGDVGILPPSYTGKVSWGGLPFPPLLLASLPELAAWLHSADSTGDLTVDADVAGVRGPPSLRMSGTTSRSAIPATRKSRSAGSSSTFR
jgi:hypothetical protein